MNHLQTIYVFKKKKTENENIIKMKKPKQNQSILSYGKSPDWES